ncbi:hypothetical protein [Streptomyces sp. P9-A4]|uniref:hypothetical protein n=1 Tax=Streptomyces sp. P9-A4 TaxID=3072285 RepID=UPI002FC5D4C6
MEHQKMLSWLDEASSYYVRDAADRLKSVSDQMATIASDLRATMRNMDWEGEAEKAFVEWATEVANSTTLLSDYSERGAKRMAENATAIASAQSAMPRYVSHANAKENLEAALKYRNDPDSQTVARNARGSMATSDDAAAIAAKELENKQAAAAEMYRLSDAYKWSSFYMKNDEAPTFPPPPGAFVPEEQGTRESKSTYIGSAPQSEWRSTGTDTRTTTSDTTRPQQEIRSTSDTNTIPPRGDTTGPTHIIRPEVRPDAPVDLGIDSVETLPQPTTTNPTTHTPGGQPPLTKPDGGTPPFVTPTGVPPFTGKGGPGPLAPTGPVTGGTRNPMNTGRGLPGPLGGTREGISGGRQVPNTQGRPQTGLPRSTVIGNEQGSGRNGTGMGRGMGGGMGGHMGGAGAGQSGISGGRRLAGEAGGVVGGKAQRAGAAGGTGRPFTPGGSGLVRGGATKPGDREEQNGERPDYLVEDEETWQQGRRVAPPVID